MIDDFLGWFTNLKKVVSVSSVQCEGFIFTFNSFATQSNYASAKESSRTLNTLSGLSRQTPVPALYKRNSGVSASKLMSQSPRLSFTSERSAVATTIYPEGNERELHRCL